VLMGLPKEITDLIERFERNREAYKSGQYNEMQLRQEFLDPLFGALGWDMNNQQGYAEAYKDVIHEDSIKVGADTKAPDYCFRIGGTRKFFLEAKKPSIDIKEAISPAFQLRRYAWSAKLPLSILSDFEEFAIYDTRIKPEKTDKASSARIHYFTYKDYEKNWDLITSVFSRDAVLKGSFDKYAEKSRLKKGTATVDDAFLTEIEDWRDMLAKNIALRNADLSTRELNFAVQRTIDRIVFLRICEDRGIEEYGRLQMQLNGTNVYKRLVQLFGQADDRYNSGLFHFQREKDRHEEPDKLTPNIAIDDKPLKDIISRLYYPESPYEFSVLSADILGQVYEQFLGKVIRLTAGHQAKVEEKPEVRKAGGVYYTPKYIVDYIVKNTVGKLVEDKKPKEVEKLTILDPACGSGSFLLGAYQYLLDWHRDWYVNDDPKKWCVARNPPLYQAQGGDYHLTTSEKKRILLNNIYGVDIDSQAVEVTKLSLLLKVLEGENNQTLANQLKMFHERALPDLGDNIKCGNSLIGPDFYQQQSMLDDEERYRVNVFDWKKEFAEIMNAGGFDAVIGNPPYIPLEMISDEQKSYFQKNHPQLERKYDTSIVFILALLQKLKRTGRLGYISSLTWQTGENFSKLRENLFKKVGVVKLINLPFDVFKSAYVDTGIYILSGSSTDKYCIYRFPKKEKVTDLDNITFSEVPVNLISSPDFKVVLDPKAQLMIARLNNSRFVPLGNFTISTQGLASNRFELSEKGKGGTWFPFLEKGQVYRYAFDCEKVVYTDMNDKLSLRTFYEKHPKILIRRVINRQDRLMAAYTDKKLVFKKDINPFIITDDNWNPYYVLGILNSRLVSYFYVNTSSIATKDDFRQTTLAELRRLPVPKLEVKDARHAEMMRLIQDMLSLNEKIPAIKTDHEKTALQRQIDATDQQIDQLVYELYGLTEEEIKIVEGKAGE
jgi:type I restriction-modification system DNA methylase subunit